MARASGDRQLVLRHGVDAHDLGCGQIGELKTHGRGQTLTHFGVVQKAGKDVGTRTGGVQRHVFGRVVAGAEADTAIFVECLRQSRKACVCMIQAAPASSLLRPAVSMRSLASLCICSWMAVKFFWHIGRLARLLVLTGQHIAKGFAQLAQRLTVASHPEWISWHPERPAPAPAPTPMGVVAGPQA